MINLQDVSLGYGSTPVLSDLNLGISKGEFVGIIGLSGAEIHTTAGRLIRFDNSDPLESTGPKFTRLLNLLKPKFNSG